MKFIFPQNYNFNSKLFGVIDYSVAITNFILWIIMGFICNFIFSSLLLKIAFFIIICFPIFLISIIGFNHENILYVIYYIFKFIKNRKIYLYKKNDYFL